MKHSVRIISATATAAMALGIGLVGAAAPAQAANQVISVTGNGTMASACYGKVRLSGKMPGGAVSYKVFYSTANGGTNCVVAYNHTGKKVNMSVYIANHGTRKNSAYNLGTFSSYAGAATIKKTNGKGIDFQVLATYNGKNYNVYKTNVLRG